MREWLRQRGGHPLLGGWFTHEWTPYLFSYGGLLLDLFAAPLLIWKRTRMAILVALSCFHFANYLLFKSALGIFPWLALTTTFLLFFPKLPRPWLWNQQEKPSQNMAMTSMIGRRQYGWLAFLGVYFLVQVGMPLRHWCYGGHSPWTQEGHRFAWRMMLFRRSGVLTLKVRDTLRGEEWDADPEEFLTANQSKEVRTMPHMILQLCHHAKRHYERLGYTGIEIRVEAWVSLNERPHQLLIDLEVDLTQVKRSLLPAKWILPWRPTPLPKQFLKDRMGDRYSAND